MGAKKLGLKGKSRGGPRGGIGSLNNHQMRKRGLRPGYVGQQHDNQMPRQQQR